MYKRAKKILYYLRDIYLVNIKWRRYRFGSNFHAGMHVYMWAKKSITIGNNCHIGRYSQIECNATIGDNVLIANNVSLVGKYDHNYQQIGVPVRFASQVMDDEYDWLEIDKEVNIGDDVWVGYGAIVLSGVNIASGCIIAAGSIVTKDTEPYGIYAGSPAKRLGDRFESKEDLDHHLKLLRIYVDSK